MQVVGTGVGTKPFVKARCLHCPPGSRSWACPRPALRSLSWINRQRGRGMWTFCFNYSCENLLISNIKNATFRPGQGEAAPEGGFGEFPSGGQVKAASLLNINSASPLLRIVLLLLPSLVQASQWPIAPTPAGPPGQPLPALSNLLPELHSLLLKHMKPRPASRPLHLLSSLPRMSPLGCSAGWLRRLCSDATSSLTTPSLSAHCAVFSSYLFCKQ